MNIAVRYQSRGGNTRAVAEIIAETIGVKAETIDVPLEDKVDVLFLGGGCYKWTADPQLLEYLKIMNPEQIGQIVPFSTAGGMKIVLDKITEGANNVGIKVNDNQLCIKVLLKGHSALGLKGGNLSKEHIVKVKNFARETLKIIENDINVH